MDGLSGKNLFLPGSNAGLGERMITRKKKKHQNNSHLACQKKTSIQDQPLYAVLAFLFSIKLYQFLI